MPGERCFVASPTGDKFWVGWPLGNGYLLRRRTIPRPASDAPSKPNDAGSGTAVDTLAVKDVVALLPLGWFRAAAGKVQVIPEMFSVDGKNVRVIVLLLLVIFPITAVVVEPLPVGLD